MAGEEKTPSLSCSWPPRAPRVAPKPPSLAAHQHGGTMLCPAAAQPLALLAALWPSSLPGSGQLVGAT